MNNPIKERKLALYLRLSIQDGELQEESNSITNQRNLLYEYVNQHPDLWNYSLEEYCDDGYSGTNLKRPAVERLLEGARQGEISGIIVKDLSRFSRDYIELGGLLNRTFPEQEVRFISVNDHYDSAEQGGEGISLTTAFQSLLYDLYSKDISEKMKKSIESRCSRGEYIFSQVPFGYEKDPLRKNQLRIQKEEAKVVQYLFRLAMECGSVKEIAERLYGEDCPTIIQMRKGRMGVLAERKYWRATVIRSILTNRFYLGEMAYGKTSCEVGGKAVRNPKETWKVIQNHHPPLVTKEEFEAAGAVIRHRRGMDF